VQQTHTLAAIFKRLAGIDIDSQSVERGPGLLAMAEDAREGGTTVASLVAANSDDQPKQLPKGVVLGKDGKP
jgi:hypothetical protein